MLRQEKSYSKNLQKFRFFVNLMYTNDGKDSKIYSDKKGMI